MFAVGDFATYPGKVRMIATAVAEGSDGGRLGPALPLRGLIRGGGSAVASARRVCRRVRAGERLAATPVLGDQRVRKRNLEHAHEARRR